VLRYCIGFYYDHERDERVVLELGYDPSRYFMSLSSGHEFPIDGPGGEIIDAIYVAAQQSSDKRACYPHYSQGVPQRYMVGKKTTIAIIPELYLI
jgi:hypothetical protein